MLPLDIEKHGSKANAWPMALPDGGRTPQYEAIWKDLDRQFQAHMDQIPAWRNVEKIAFLNGLDDSYGEDAYEKMIYYGKLLHEALGRGWFKYRIDGGYSRGAMEKMHSEIDLWVCHTVSFDIETIDYFRKKGRRDHGLAESSGVLLPAGRRFVFTGPDTQSLFDTPPLAVFDFGAGRWDLIVLACAWTPVGRHYSVR